QVLYPAVAALLEFFGGLAGNDQFLRITARSGIVEFTAVLPGLGPGPRRKLRIPGVSTAARLADGLLGVGGWLGHGRCLPFWCARGGLPPFTSGVCATETSRQPDSQEFRVLREFVQSYAQSMACTSSGAMRARRDWPWRDTAPPDIVPSPQ